MPLIYVWRDVCISRYIKLPIDSLAMITSSRVVGSKFVNISPAADIKLILHGGKIEYTQAEANMGGIMDRILGMFTKRKWQNSKCTRSGEASCSSKVFKEFTLFLAFSAVC